MTTSEGIFETFKGVRIPGGFMLPGAAVMPPRNRLLRAENLLKPEAKAILSARARLKLLYPSERKSAIQGMRAAVT